MNTSFTTPLEPLERRLISDIMRLNKKWGLIQDGDRIMVCLSGGKDSYALLSLLLAMRPLVPFHYELVGVNLDQGHPGFTQHVIEDHCRALGVPAHMIVEDTYSIVKQKVPQGKTYCSVCSRLRRGILYSAAVDLGCTKMALGHHRDDILQTALLNLFYAGKLGTMPPLLRSDDGRNTVIRPLALCAEEDLRVYATAKAFPILPCNLCGSQDGLHRQQVKALIEDLHRRNPNVKGNMLAALGNVQLSHLLDLELRRQHGLDPHQGPDPWLDGDGDVSPLPPADAPDPA
jgi:tRNA 2-thiocytidine biosynthesis protein TtcA